MTDRIARSILWVLCSRGVLQVISFASTLMVARLLAPADYGVMALASMWIVITAHVAELGLGNAILQFPDLDDRELNACFWLMSGLAVLGYVGLCLSASAIGEWFGTPALPAVLVAVGLTLPLAALRTVPETLLRKQVALDKVSQAEIIASLVGLPLVLALAFAGAGVWALVSGALATAAVQGILTFRFARWAPGLRIGGSRLLPMVRYSLACVGARFCWAAYQGADTFVLGKTAGGAVLGIYAIGKQLAMLPLEKLGPIVNQIAAPVMAELQQDRDAVGAALLRGFRIVAWATLPACLAIALLADDLVRVVLTEKWSPAVPIIYVLSAYTITRSLAVLFPTVLLARYREKTVFAYNVALLGVMPLAFWIGAQAAGAMGVAAAWALIHPVALIWLAHRALEEVHVSWGTLFRELSGPAAASLAMGLAIVALNWSLASWDGFGRLALTIPVAMAAFAAGLWRFGGAMQQELRELAVRLCRPLTPQGVTAGHSARMAAPPFVPERP
jgi:O-antigen/teichoic acid export membrane protein